MLRSFIKSFTLCFDEGMAFPSLPATLPFERGNQRDQQPSRSGPPRPESVVGPWKVLSSDPTASPSSPPSTSINVNLSFSLSLLFPPASPSIHPDGDDADHPWPCFADSCTDMKETHTRGITKKGCDDPPRAKTPTLKYCKAALFLFCSDKAALGYNSCHFRKRIEVKIHYNGGGV
ncbi:hypothetical protein L228DRAFT_34737 [Xylona heveae TC161]|uniref:Uncharacterized protein n=1 Tax=Xylona heveae (strain CBS 132557 / TC161) TaxID=1328760 RepID=A0A165A7D0_XYLHT|nr:hypothetical protein L228DRAFT_34737 [Xylona heveae TC161]KZF20058.1 hypothetical protein L228DRAFT_34737 [Xylona heveae TC161]